MQAVIFGWKRDNYEKDIEDCESIARELTKNNFNIYTGGGGGFMLAANKGCYEVDPSKSYAVSVKCLYGNEGQTNTYYKKENLIVTDTFAERKELLCKNMDLYIFFPGGAGTLDEFFELITLFKTGELEEKPVVLYNFKYWSTMKSFFEFNKLNWPESYISCIINTVDEFNSFYKETFKSTELVVKKKVSFDNDENDDIESYNPLKESNIFLDNSNLSKLIDEIFNDPNFKNDLEDILNETKNDEDLINLIIQEGEDGEEDDDDNSMNEIVEIIINDDNEIVVEIYSDNFEDESSESDNSYSEINLDSMEKSSDSDSDSDSN